jgi:hypothetical protein
MVFLRNISVDTLHKGDTEDDDDDYYYDNNNNTVATTAQIKLPFLVLVDPAPDL